jgi:hypothetical protein
MDCSKHKKEVEGYQGSLQELAEDLGDLHYESLAEFLGHLSEKLEKDSIADMKRNRMKLAGSLHHAADDIHSACIGIERAWKISKPYMEGNGRTELE